MTTYDTRDYQPGSGKVVKSDGNVVNEADGYNDDGSQNVVVKGRSVSIQQIIGTGDNSVSVAATQSQSSAFIDISMFESVAIYVVSDQAYDLTRYYSYNGVITDQGNAVATNAGATNGASRYHSFLTNNDAVPYLKISVKNDSTTTAANVKVYLVGTAN